MLVAQFYRELKNRVMNNFIQTNEPTQLQSIITLAIQINNCQHEQELKKRDKYNFSNKRYQNFQKPLKRNQYEMVPIELIATE